VAESVTKECPIGEAGERVLERLAGELLFESFFEDVGGHGGIAFFRDEFGDVADHCTVCHKCAKPCPVDIDFGDVSMAMRDLLRRMGKKRFRPAAAAAAFFLEATNPNTIKLARAAMVGVGD